MRPATSRIIKDAGVRRAFGCLCTPIDFRERSHVCYGEMPQPRSNSGCVWMSMGQWLIRAADSVVAEQEEGALGSIEWGWVSFRFERQIRRRGSLRVTPNGSRRMLWRSAAAAIVRGRERKGTWIYVICLLL